ncbi:TPA: hypothetical protein MB295_005303, partial [Klebsiella pneumoniae]|nr:hypothetical protein [Klebsiella pneumoniae]
MKLMNHVKTIFTYKFITIILFLLILMVLLIIPGMKNDPIYFDCNSDIHVYSKDNKNEFKAVIRMFVHMAKNGKGVVREYGTIRYGDDAYLMDRSVNIYIYHEEDERYQIKRRPPVVNEGDNLPDSLYYMMVSKDKVLNYRMQKLNNDL